MNNIDASLIKNLIQYLIYYISDLIMPSMNGMELLKTIKNFNHSVRTVPMTAIEFGDKLFQRNVQTQIINGFLQKPIMLKDLVEEVDIQLHIYQLQQHKTILQ